MKFLLGAVFGLIFSKQDQIFLVFLSRPWAKQYVQHHDVLVFLEQTFSSEDV